MSRSWSADEFAELLSAPGVQMLTTQQGFVLFRVTYAEAEILTVAVQPSGQRQGIGSRLVADALVAAKHAGARRLFLEVAADNNPARALYEKCGFSTAAVRKGYYISRSGQKTDAIVLSRDL